MTYNEIINTVLRSLDRERPLLPIPTPIVSRALRLLERAMGTNAPITWDEAELLEANMVAKGGMPMPKRSASHRSQCRGVGG